MLRKYELSLLFLLICSCSTYDTVSFSGKTELHYYGGTTSVRFRTERFLYSPPAFTAKNKVIKEALTEYRQGNLMEAERLFSELLRYYPDDAGIINNLGVIYESRGDYSSALPCYINACRLDSSGIYLHNLKNATRF